MKWRAPSERVQFWIASPVVVPMAIIAAPFFLLLAGMLWVENQLERRFGATVEWTPWFAWRPVKLNFDWDDMRWAWLETVDRRRLGGWPVEYRAAPGGVE